MNHQIGREQLTDDQWGALCQFFDLSRDLKTKALERKSVAQTFRRSTTQKANLRNR